MTNIRIIWVYHALGQTCELLPDRTRLCTWPSTHVVSLTTFHIQFHFLFCSSLHSWGWLSWWLQYYSQPPPFWIQSFDFI